MYPKISDFINDLFGTSLCLPIQSFGFFLALAFAAAYWVSERELKRKEKLGIFPLRKMTIQTQGQMSEREVAIQTLIYAVLGYKLGLAFESYGPFCENPQDAILSAEGSVMGALVGALLGGGYTFWQYRKAKGATPETKEVEIGPSAYMATYITIAFVAGLLGAKIFHNLEYWDQFMQDPVGSLVSFSGLTFYGGLIVAAVAIGWYVYRQGYKLLPFADSVSPALILAYGVGRIGCQVAGDGDWGTTNTAPNPYSWLPDWLWSYDYPHNVLREGVPMPGCVGDYCNHLPVNVWPTPLYETLMALAIFGALWAIRKRLPFYGQISAIYLVLNGMERFAIEQIRVNVKGDFLGMNLTQAELIASVMMLLGVALFALTTFVWKQKTSNTATN